MNNNLIIKILEAINKDLLYTLAMLEPAAEYTLTAIESGMTDEEALTHLETPEAQRVIKQRGNDILK